MDLFAANIYLDLLCIALWLAFLYPEELEEGTWPLEIC
jgi:hypothetical protein